MTTAITLPLELSGRAPEEEFERRVEATLIRTPEQIVEARKRVLALTPEPRPLVSVITYGELPAFAEQNV